MSAGTEAVTVSRLRAKRAAGERIVMVTASDFSLARIADEAGVDVVLVGDSLGQVALGYDSTLPVTMEEMLVFTRADARGARRALVVADMPFLSYQVSPEEARRNRAYEKHLSPKYLEELNQAYNHFFFHYSATPLLVINTDVIDFVQNPGDLEDLANQILHAKRGTEYYTPPRSVKKR